jgi:hypothetical protein
MTALRLHAQMGAATRAPIRGAAQA